LIGAGRINKGRQRAAGGALRSAAVVWFLLISAQKQKTIKAAGMPDNEPVRLCFRLIINDFDHGNAALMINIAMRDCSRRKTFRIGGAKLISC
jgi:hypothetical protein